MKLFRLWGKDVVVVDKDNKEEEVLTPVCSLLKILADTRDEKNENWGRYYECEDMDGHAHRIALPNELFVAPGRPIIKALLSRGLRIHPDEDQAVMEYIQSHEAPKVIRCVTKTGWHGLNYILPDEALQPEGNEEVVYQPTHFLTHRYSISGTDADWREHVGRPCEGNSRLILTVCAALTGTVLRPLGEESGGIHLFGVTSCGKTTAAIVGGSVLGGGGENGFVESWLTTANALEGSAELHNDSCLALDEISLASPKQIVDIVYTLVGGLGKNRMTAEITIRERASWKISVVSTGELTIQQHAHLGGQFVRGGVDIRILNIPADAGRGMGLFEDLHGFPTPKEFAGHVKQTPLKYYGAPSRTWLRHLVDHRETCLELLRDGIEEFEAAHLKSDYSPEVQRVVRRFGLMASVGELATRMGITGWTPGQAMWAAARCLEAWLEQRGGKGSFDAAEMVSVVRLFLQQHRQSRFQSISPAGMQTGTYPIRDLAGYIHADYFLFNTEVFKRDVCRGYDHRAVYRALLAAGLLGRDKDRPDKQVRINGETLRFYAVKKTILDE